MYKIHNISKQLYALILAPLLTITLSPFLVLILLINEIFRLIISTVIYIKYKNRVQICSHGEDGMWEFKCFGNSRMNIGFLLTDQINEPELFVHKFNEGIFESEGVMMNGKSIYVKLKRTISVHFGYVCWEENENFNIKNHVRSLSNKIIGHDELMDVFSELSRDMSYSKPQWEIVIVPKYKESSDEVVRSILVLRFHHAYMDGLSLLMLLKNISSNYKFQLDPLTFKIPLKLKILFYLNFIIYGPVTFISMLINKYKTYWYVNKNTKGKKLYTWVRNRIRTEDIKKIRTLTNASVGNIVSLAFQISAQSVLGADKMIKELRVGDLIAFLPYPDMRPQNRFTAYSFSIKNNEKLDLITKLKGIQKESMGSITGPQPLLFYYAFRLFARLPLFLYSYIFSGTQDSMYISYVPCSKEEFGILDGIKALDFGGYPPFPNDTGIIMGIINYKGFINLCGTSDISCLTRDELTKIFKNIPKVIDEMLIEIKGGKEN